MHAKIYSNNEQAIICSCNLSIASQKEWLEGGVRVNDQANLEKVNLFFYDNLKAVNLVSKDRLVQLKGAFGIALDELREQTFTPNLAENVWSGILS